MARVTAMTPATTTAREVTFKSEGETLPATFYGDSSVGVVLCPPHPLFGGSRKDTRIVRIARELASHNISALCIDYGSYGKGVREVENVLSMENVTKWHPTQNLNLFTRKPKEERRNLFWIQTISTWKTIR